MPTLATIFGRKTSSEPLREQVLQEGPLTVDAEAGVVRGVKILGARSRNGRTYSEQAMKGAVRLYEGVRVNIDHPDQGPTAPRRYADRFGQLENVRHEPGRGLFGDLKYNPRHALADQFAWDAEHAPGNVGLSHNASGKPAPGGDRRIIESIDRVRSVDVVADPATNDSLFESENQPVAVTIRKLIEATKYPHSVDTLIEMLPGEMAAEEPVEMPADSGADPVESVAAALSQKVGEAILDAGVADAEVGKMAKAASQTVNMVRDEIDPSAAAETPDEEGGESESAVPESLINKAIGKALRPLLEEQRSAKKRMAARDFLDDRKLAPHQIGKERMTALVECEDEIEMAKLVESWPPVFRGAPAPLFAPRGNQDKPRRTLLQSRR